MNAERWHKLGFTIITGEYAAGTIAGTGVGILLGRLWFEVFASGPGKDLSTLVAFIFVVSGSLWARSIQGKRLQKEKTNEG
jgi:uncharacterized protein YcfJ